MGMVNGNILIILMLQFQDQTEAEIMGEAEEEFLKKMEVFIMKEIIILGILIIV